MHPSKLFYYPPSSHPPPSLPPSPPLPPLSPSVTSSFLSLPLPPSFPPPSPLRPPPHTHTYSLAPFLPSFPLARPAGRPHRRPLRRDFGFWCRRVLPGGPDRLRTRVHGMASAANRLRNARPRFRMLKDSDVRAELIRLISVHGRCSTRAGRRRQRALIRRTGSARGSRAIGLSESVGCRRRPSQQPARQADARPSGPGRRGAIRVRCDGRPLVTGNAAANPCPTRINLGGKKND